MPKDTRHFSELLQAVRDNNLEQVKTIWEGHIRSQNNKNGGQLCRATSTGYAAVLLLAATLPDDKIMRYLIATTLDLNYLGDPYVDGVAHRSLETITPLHAAVRAGSLAAVTALLEANADADRVDGHGRTPLHTAAMRADCRTARMLLYRGAHVQKTDSDGLVPMQMAARYGHVELVRVLLEHGATVFHEGQCGPSPLHIAAAEGHLPLVDLFLRYVNVNSQVASDATSDVDLSGKTPLHLAASNGMIEVAQFLLQHHSADANLLDARRQTALHCAVRRAHDARRMRRRDDYEEVALLMMKRGATPDVRDETGSTPLHLAAAHQYYRVAESLLSGGASTRMRNAAGKTALEMVPEFDVGMKQLFLKYAAFSSSYLDEAALMRRSDNVCDLVQTVPVKIDMAMNSRNNKTKKTVSIMAPQSHIGNYVITPVNGLKKTVVHFKQVPGATIYNAYVPNGV